MSYGIHPFINPAKQAIWDQRANAIIHSTNKGISYGIFWRIFHRLRASLHDSTRVFTLLDGRWTFIGFPFEFSADVRWMFGGCSVGAHWMLVGFLLDARRMSSVYRTYLYIRGIYALLWVAIICFDLLWFAMLCYAMLSKIYRKSIVHACAHLCTLVHAAVASCARSRDELCTVVPAAVPSCAHLCTPVHTCAHTHMGKRAQVCAIDFR